MLDIELLIPREKDALIAEMVDNNVYFTEKILTESGAVYKKRRNWPTPLFPYFPKHTPQAISNNDRLPEHNCC